VGPAHGAARADKSASLGFFSVRPYLLFIFLTMATPGLLFAVDRAPNASFFW